MRVVQWTGRCLVCGWKVADTVRRVDLDTSKHTKDTGHPTVQEGT